MGFHNRYILLTIFFILFFIHNNLIISQHITVSAIGDIMAHHNLQEYALVKESRYHVLFNHTKQIFEKDHLTIGNLETPVCGDREYEGYPKFNARPELLDAVKDASIELVSFANNHTFDQGLDGITLTLKELDNRKILHAGAGNNKKEAIKPVIMNIEGVLVGFLSTTWTTNIYRRNRNDDGPYVSIVHYSNEKMVKTFCSYIAELKKKVDVVIVGYHAGVEYVATPVEAKVEAMKKFADAGADVILGHHPHVLQPVEYYQTADNRYALIAYSLGNFISAQARYLSPLTSEQEWIFDSVLSRTAESVILQFEIIKNRDSISIVYPRIIPIFNICYNPVIEDRTYTGFMTMMIDDILTLDGEKSEINHVDEIQELVSYRLAKIKSLIPLPIQKVLN